MSDGAPFAHADAREQTPAPARWLTLAALVAALLAVFVVRSYLAQTGDPPRLADLFEILIVGGSALVLLTGHRSLTRTDWLVGAGVGLFLGLQLPAAELFRPFPFLDTVRDVAGQALIRGAFAAVATLGGLVIAHRDGPVRLRLAGGEWRRALVSFAIGAAIGLPLAVLNAFANAWLQGRPFQWQNPLTAAVDALQPAVFEEVLYRLALLGLLWLVLRRSWPSRQAAWLAGLLSLLVHTYGAHYSDEFLTAPVATLTMGAAMGLIWGVPLTVLALRRDLDSAVGFHWVQDFARFWAGL